VENWFWTSWGEAGGVVLTGIAVYAMIGVFTRLFGLRSFAKLTAFDAAVTVAIGSIFASAVTARNPTILLTGVSLLTLFAMQSALSSLRRRSRWARNALENDPALVFTRGVFIRENMVRANLTEGDVWGKLREANALDPDAVHAVIVETTGDVLVLHGEGPVDARLLQGVRDGHRVRSDVVSMGA